MTQVEALTILKTGSNVFLTGEPGSGKTHIINTFISWLRARNIETAVTAATGIAATHISGITLHSWSGIGVARELSDADIDRIASKEYIARRLQKARILIIEEISMLAAATFEMVDAVCREARRDQRPFGGLTVILVGDFFQLPPVSRGEEAQFVYMSPLWHALNPLICYLTEQYRQDDAEFLELLSAIRSSLVTPHHLEQLKSRRVKEDHLPDSPKLFSHNIDVDRLNNTLLATLPGKSHVFQMHSKGKDTLIEGLKRGCLSPERLELKEGASVMFTKNSPQGKFVNGTLGTIHSFDAEGLPIVKIRNNILVITEPMEWQVEEDNKVRATISQIPLRLAYAMTVHKSQGMSMDSAIIDLSRAFEYGQGYVALSRVRRLSGIHLLGLNERSLEVHPKILQKDREFRAASEAVQETFAAMPEDKCTELQKRFVKAMGNACVKEEKGNLKVWGKKAIILPSTLPGRLAKTLSVVRTSANLSAAAKTRGIVVSTIMKHLEEIAKLGILGHDDFAQFLPSSASLDEISEALTISRNEHLGPVFHTLSGRYSFETIRLVRLNRSL